MDLENTLKKIAVDFNYTTGKWIAAVPWHRADETWQKIVEHVLSGYFSGDDVTHVVVKARQSGADNPNNLRGNFVIDLASIMVCTRDWTDGRRTKVVGKKLMELNLDVAAWKYKPNVISLLSYDNNNKKYRFPYIYTFP